MSDRSKTLEAVKAQIRSFPDDMSKGQRALESLSLYRSARLPVPDDVLRTIDNCYRHFIEGKPVAYWPQTEREVPSPMTLGEAFGVPDLRGGVKIALKRKRMALARPRLVAMFTGLGRKKVPRGRAYFAEKIGAIDPSLTVSAVEDWVSGIFPASPNATDTRVRRKRASQEVRTEARSSDALASGMATWRHS